MLVYPVSAPENWKDILNELRIPWVLSPLHDKDIDNHGELKKPHWHVLLMFEGNKSYEQVKAIADKINAPKPEKCVVARGAVRYMLHIDDPDKYQYSLSELQTFGGADIAKHFKPTQSERYELIKEMMDFIDDNNILEMKDLFFHARNERFDDWFPLLCDNSAYVISLHIKSNRHGK